MIHRDGEHRFGILFQFRVEELLFLVRDSVLRHLTWYVIGTYELLPVLISASQASQLQTSVLPLVQDY